MKYKKLTNIPGEFVELEKQNKTKQKNYILK